MRITSIMILAALVALTLGAVQAVSVYDGYIVVRLAIGVVPMGVSLAVGRLIGNWRFWSRRFLLWFEIFGVTAIALYIVAVIRFGETLVVPYLRLAPVTFRTDPRVTWTTLRVTLTYCTLSLWAVIPQLTFALVGGLLFRNLRIR